MYYKNNNVYISKHNILFDLNKLDIFIINDELKKKFEELYYKKNSDTNNDIYGEMRDLFFNHDKTNFDENITGVTLLVSNQCNMKCKYCYAHNGNYGLEDSLMPLDLAEYIANYIKEYLKDVKKISIFGGEPFLNVHAMERICESLNNDIKFATVSNLSIVNQNIIDLVKKYDILITASIDGPKDINDFSRIFKNNKGTYDIVSKNIIKLQNETNNIIMLEATYTNYTKNKYSPLELAEYLYKTFGIKNIFVSNVITENIDIKLKELFEFNIDVLEKYLDQFIYNINEGKYFFLNSISTPFYMFLTKRYNEFFCYAGLSSILIDHKGNVWPCQAFINKNDFCFGNIVEERVEISRLKNYNKVRNFLLNLRKSNYECCEGCIAKYWCKLCIPNTPLINSDSSSCCDEERCNYNKIITELVLEKISQLIVDNKFYQLSLNAKNLINNRVEY